MTGFTSQAGSAGPGAPRNRVADAHPSHTEDRLVDMANTPRNLAQALTHYTQAYLLTASQGAPHAVPVSARLEDGAVIVEPIGRHTRDNVARQPGVALLWPPASASGYSLVVDGQATLADTALRVAPTRAVLQRPTVGAHVVSGGTCAADCIELDLYLRG